MSGATGTAPRVSVVLPLYNAVAFIDETIESVLAQTFADTELLIVDDGSSDGSYARALDWERRAPDRIRVLTHDGHANRGLPATRNAGIEQARGALVAFIDADDVWPLEKLAQQVAVFDRHPEVAMAAGAALYWSSWQGGEDRLFHAGHRHDTVIPAGEPALAVYPLGPAQAPCPSVLMLRREVLRAVGGFEASFTGKLQVYEDQAFLIKIYLSYATWFDGRCQLKYRQHADSLMARIFGDGQYYRIRSQYLDWLARYLRRQNKTSPQLTVALWRARMANRAAQMTGKARPAVRRLRAAARRRE